MLGDENPGGSMEVASAAIVTEPRPQSQNFLLIGGRQIGDRGKRRQESLEVRHDRGHGRLLQHDFANPDAIRIAITPPRQDSLMLIKPSEEFTAKRRRIWLERGHPVRGRRW